MDRILYNIKRFVPQPLLNFIRPYYHRSLVNAAARYYRFPSRHITIIAVTGTKGKSTTTEIITHILEKSGHKVASLSTIQFKIGDKVRHNLYKMTTPGRGFVQNFLREAVDAGCTHAVIEMTSEGVKSFRHLQLELDALVFTNLTPEHIESHGSFEAYKEAKLKLAETVAKSAKRPRFLVANVDDEHGQDFLNFDVENKLPYSLSMLGLYTLHKDSFSIVIEGHTIRVPLLGLFNIYNTLGAITITRAMGINLEQIDNALRTLPTIRGRVELIKSNPKTKKQVTVVVDYAHTPDSLTKLYQAFPDVPKIAIIGNTGGGRDTWKRPEMAAIAEKYCDYIIFTNEDPYDESPHKIIEDMIKGLSNDAQYEIIIDRREAIATALRLATNNGYVMLSGKGTDPFIMGPNNTKEPWSDATVASEEIERFQQITNVNL